MSNLLEEDDYYYQIPFFFVDHSMTHTYLNDELRSFFL